jgi:hypothetical protein
MDGMAHEGRLRKLFARPDSKRSWSAVRQLAWKDYMLRDRKLADSRR